MISTTSYAQDKPDEPPSLMPQWRQLQQVPILNYQWPGHWPKGTDIDANRQTIFDDFRAMGFNGIYKVDQDGTYGSDLFKAEGGFGLMRQARVGGSGKPVIRADGTELPMGRKRHVATFQSIFAEENVQSFYQGEVDFAQSYGVERMFHVGDTLVQSSWDETGAYARREIEYGYNVKEEYIAFLRDVVFRDAGPGEDTNKDQWTYNRLTMSDLKTWDEIPLPFMDDRYKQAGAWKLWYDFHGYYTSLFFRRGGEYMTEKLGQPVEFYTFPHGMVKWPSAANSGGVDLYWEAKLNRVLTVEDCQWDHPGTAIHYAITNQLSRRYGLPVMGWAWFIPNADRANDPREIERGMARLVGNDTHGVIMWLYADIPYGTWRDKPEAREALAKWQHTFQAHWDFLRTTTVPAPQVAVLFPRNTGNMYKKYGYPKCDYGWACQALSELQIPYEIVMDNQLELEPEVLDDYKVLIVPSATWESPQVRERIESFIAGGGYVMASGDSFMMDTASGNATDFLYAQFGVRPNRMYKGTYQPSYNSLEEEAWARDFAAKFQNPTWAGDTDKDLHKTRNDTATPVAFTDDDLATLRAALPATSGTGLEQSLYDPRVPQLIKAEIADTWVPATYRTYHDIITGETAPEATVIATYGTEPAAVETDNTLWVGFRPGHDQACLFPIYQMRTFGEPIWPFEINTATTAAEREAPTRWFARIVEKAGIAQPLTVTGSNGEPAPSIEVLSRTAANGDRLIFLINHDEELGGSYILGGPMLQQMAAIADLRSSERLHLDRSAANLKALDDLDVTAAAEAPKPTAPAAGTITVSIPAGTVAILAAGSEAFVAGRIEAQARVPKTIPPMPKLVEAVAK